MREAENILSDKGIRITPMRLLVLESLLEHKGTYGLSEVEKMLPHSDRITIYRTLKTFSESGILHPIESGTAEIKYAMCKAFCTSNQHLDRHPHFHCQKCKRIICLEALEVPALQYPNDYLVQEVSMTVKGICAQCQP